MVQIGATMKGGLGNQMFIAAACKSLALKLGGSISYDLSSYRGKKERSFDLDIFGIEYVEVKKELLVRKNFKSGLMNLHYNSDKSSLWPTFKEAEFAYDSDFETISSDIWLEGYFQSWKYFSSEINDIRRYFTFPASNHIYDKIVSTVGSRFISIHVRRGDYLISSTRNFHGLASESYFKRGLDLLLERENLPVVIFSDSEEPLSKFFVENSDLILYPDAKTHSGLYMGAMSRGRSFLISNSSFSWWAAFLSGEDQKTVIAPRPWISQGDISGGDLLPSDWITLGIK